MSEQWKNNYKLETATGAHVKLRQRCPYLEKLCDGSTYCPSASNPDYLGGMGGGGAAAVRRHEGRLF